MSKDIETGAQGGLPHHKDYQDPPPVPLFDTTDIKWSFFRAGIAEFVATLLFLYITVLTIIGYASQTDPHNGGDDCGGVGILGISWAVGGMIFVLVYCTAGISGWSGHSVKKVVVDSERKQDCKKFMKDYKHEKVAA